MEVNCLKHEVQSLGSQISAELTKVYEIMPKSPFQTKESFENFEASLGDEDTVGKLVICLEFI